MYPSERANSGRRFVLARAQRPEAHSLRLSEFTPSGQVFYIDRISLRFARATGPHRPFRRAKHTKPGDVSSGFLFSEDQMTYLSSLERQQATAKIGNFAVTLDK